MPLGPDPVGLAVPVEALFGDADARNELREVTFLVCPFVDGGEARGSLNVLLSFFWFLGECHLNSAGEVWHQDIGVQVLN